MQYAWPHPRLPLLYCACSNGSPGVLGDTHVAVALRISSTGALSQRGEPVALPSRPIHITVDEEGSHALIAYNDPSGLTVHPIDNEGYLGAPLAQRSRIDIGIFAHQVRVMPSNRTAVLVTRGNDARDSRTEDPGALKVFDYRSGQLADQTSIAPNGGYGFGPRHLDFHPAKSWVYVSLERQNQLQVYYAENDELDALPRFTVDTLAEPHNVQPEQRAGTVHVHPRGHVVYVANRANARSGVGESNIAVFAIDDSTGEPRAIQHIDTHGFVPRTFSIDASGRLMIVANSEARDVRVNGAVEHVTPSLAVFRIADEGTLTYVSSHAVDAGTKTLFWAGLLPPANS
jgi:6-phosphogluconolactonase (cycloisomerase 2 family)